MTKKTKIILTTFCVGMFLSLSHNLNAQSKSKQKNSLDSTALEKFLTVKQDYLKIPITKKASGHLHVNVVVNGVDGEFILDTGASSTVIDAKKISKFNLQTQDTNYKGVGAGGTQTMQKATNNTFKLGDLKKSNFAVYVINLDHVNNALTSMGLNEVEGVIGADILTENKAIIDYSNLVLYLRK